MYSKLSAIALTLAMLIGAVRCARKERSAPGPTLITIRCAGAQDGLHEWPWQQHRVGSEGRGG